MTGLASEVENGCNFDRKDHMYPPDVLVPNWSFSHSVAFNLKIIHPLNLANKYGSKFDLRVYS